MEHTGFDLVVTDAKVLHGQARIRDTRVPVSVILDCLAEGMSAEEIHQQYPSLPEGSVPAAVTYAAQLAREEVQTLPPSSPQP